MRSPHILLIYNGCWYVWNARRPLIVALQEMGCSITVLAPRDEYSERLQALGVGYREIAMDAKSVNPFRDLATFWELYRAYKAERPQLVLHYTIKPNIYGSIAARFLKIPAVNNVTGLGAAFDSSKLQAVDPNAGTGLELNAIAAVVIGGTSLMGGRGSVIGSFLGVLIMATLGAGLAQLGASEPVKLLITGLVIVAAVIVDAWRAGKLRRKSA